MADGERDYGSVEMNLDAIFDALNDIDDTLVDIGGELPSRRELFSALAMHAMMTTGALDSPSFTATQAVKYADALIAELAKPVGAKEGV